MTQATPASMEQLLERSKPRNPWRPALAFLVVFAVLALIAYVIVQVTSPSPDSRWRTARVGAFDVSSAITGVASIEPVSEATVAFPVAGTVKTVEVSQGANVQPGQAMATLDPTSFETTLHAKQASLAKAQLNLANALDAQAAADAASTTTTTAGGGGGGGGGGSALQQAQARVVAAQRQVDTAIAQANTALTAMTQPCAAPSTQQQIATCQGALQNAASAQTSVASAQQNLATATSQLDALLNQQATTTTVPGGGGRPTASTTTTVPSAATIASLQAQVDAAQAAVTVAEQNLLQTVIVSPIAGTIVAINLVVGQSVTANSTTATVLVQGPGGFESTMAVSVDQVPNIRINQRATVLPDGSETPITGRVSLVALSPNTTTTGTTPTYRVTIALDGRSSALRNGSIGTGAIITATAPNAIAVPTSAIHLSTTGRTVDVLANGRVTAVPVEIGVAGDDRTQITTGLEIGQLVVLADLDEPLPGSATKARTTTNNSNANTNRLTLPNGQTVQIPAGGFGGNGTGTPTGGNAPNRPGG